MKIGATVDELKKAHAELENEIISAIQLFEMEFHVRVAGVELNNLSRDPSLGTSPQTVTPINNPLHQCSIGTEL